MSTTSIDQTQQRFLRAVFDRIPLERVVELHLFAPIRQGGVETGLAVLAALQELPEGAPGLEVPDEQGLVVESSPQMELQPVDSPSAEDAAHETGDEQAAPDADVDGRLVQSAESPRDDAAAETSDAEIASSEGTLDGVSEEEESSVADTDAEASPAVVRHVVYTARYVLVLKGADRGKWEVDVRDEADAPLITVDAVVRGVQRRVGDLAEVERLGPEQLAIAVSDTPWRASE